MDPAEIGPRLVAEVRANRGHDLVPFTGQSAGLVHDVAPAAEIVSRLMAEAKAALTAATASLAERRASGTERPPDGAAGTPAPTLDLADELGATIVEHHGSGPRLSVGRPAR